MQTIAVHENRAALTQFFPCQNHMENGAIV